jgi:translation initiation factor IF-3
MSVDRALALAREADLDLVEVGPNDNPPVCRIMDYGKFRYELQKKQRGQAHHPKIKEIHLRPGTGRHDLMVKVNRAKEFLGEGDKVLVVVQFKGREAAHIEEGMRVMHEVLGALTDVAKVENLPRTEGKQKIVCLLAPLKPPERDKGKDKDKVKEKEKKLPKASTTQEAAAIHSPNPSVPAGEAQNTVNLPSPGAS